MTIPYGRHLVDEEDIQAVAEILRGNWLTTGPTVEAFEQAVASYVGARHAVAVNSGTAALHAALAAAGVGPGDEVIVPPITFAATANVAVHLGAKPVFVDVRAEDLLIDPAKVEAAITDRTKAIIPVDYAGQPCDYAGLMRIGTERGVTVLADGCHALGARVGDRGVGAIADLTAFSFHPVKHITTGEGGMVTTASAEAAEKMRRFRNHGITKDMRQRAIESTWHYEIHEPGYNYRLPDINCALGISQLRRLPGWIARRQEIAARYDAAFAGSDVRPLTRAKGVSHAYHLYVVQLEGKLAGKRDKLFAALRDAGLGVNVHYVPVHLHPYYRESHGTGPGLCPVAESAYEKILTLPLFHGMSDADAESVVRVVREVTSAHAR